jgi:hypothetical protein
MRSRTGERLQEIEPSSRSAIPSAAGDRHGVRGGPVAAGLRAEVPDADAESVRFPPGNGAQDRPRCSGVVVIPVSGLLCWLGRPLG